MVLPGFKDAGVRIARAFPDRIQRLLLEETPVITAYFYDWLSVTGKHVSGVRPTAMGQLDLSGTRLLER